MKKDLLFSCIHDGEFNPVVVIDIYLFLLCVSIDNELFAQVVKISADMNKNPW